MEWGRLGHHQRDGGEKGEDEHVLRGEAKNLVQGPSFVDAYHLAPGE